MTLRELKSKNIASCLTARFDHVLEKPRRRRFILFKQEVLMLCVIEYFDDYHKMIDILSSIVHDIAIILY